MGTCSSAAKVVPINRAPGDCRVHVLWDVENVSPQSGEDVSVIDAFQMAAEAIFPFAASASVRVRLFADVEKLQRHFRRTMTRCGATLIDNGIKKPEQADKNIERAVGELLEDFGRGRTAVQIAILLVTADLDFGAVKAKILEHDIPVGVVMGSPETAGVCSGALGHIATCNAPSGMPDKAVKVFSRLRGEGTIAAEADHATAELLARRYWPLVGGTSGIALLPSLVPPPGISPDGSPLRRGGAKTPSSQSWAGSRGGAPLPDAHSPWLQTPDPSTDHADRAGFRAAGAAETLQRGPLFGSMGSGPAAGRGEPAPRLQGAPASGTLEAGSQRETPSRPAPAMSGAGVASTPTRTVLGDTAGAGAVAGSPDLMLAGSLAESGAFVTDEAVRRRKGKQCRTCGNHRYQEEFTRTQWKRPSGLGNCIACKGTPPSGTGSAQTGIRGSGGRHHGRDDSLTPASAPVPILASREESNMAESAGLAAAEQGGDETEAAQPR